MRFFVLLGWLTARAIGHVLRIIGWIVLHIGRGVYLVGLEILARSEMEQRWQDVAAVIEPKAPVARRANHGRRLHQPSRNGKVKA
jgi:hypothetical protein